MNVDIFKTVTFGVKSDMVKTYFDVNKKFINSPKLDHFMLHNVCQF